MFALTDFRPAQLQIRKDNSKLTSRIEKLNPDLIVPTGRLSWMRRLLQRKAGCESYAPSLPKTAPTYYIYGNNEVERFYDTPTQEALDRKSEI